MEAGQGECEEGEEDGEGEGEERGEHRIITTTGEVDTTITMEAEGITIIMVEEDSTTTTTTIIITTECKPNMGTVITIVTITTTVAIQDEV
jgi:hypothetical protein